jgi:hypothetical protein
MKRKGTGNGGRSKKRKEKQAWTNRQAGGRNRSITIRRRELPDELRCAAKKVSDKHTKHKGTGTQALACYHTSRIWRRMGDKHVAGEDPQRFEIDSIRDPQHNDLPFCTLMSYLSSNIRDDGPRTNVGTRFCFPLSIPLSSLPMGRCAFVFPSLHILHFPCIAKSNMNALHIHLHMRFHYANVIQCLRGGFTSLATCNARVSITRPLSAK